MQLILSHFTAAYKIVGTISHFITAYKIVHTKSSVYFILNTKKGLDKYRSFVQYNDDVVTVIVVVVVVVVVVVAVVRELYLQ